ncbi:hypothetical protein HDF17_001903 [Granulicella arctica]|uniref:Uncharacterized protein n=1 Tax=Granulicella arctica TaxID=940613 RepID=A0A7Y9PGP8_9BACT|nr:hypothetical protein [Granulicella arctica]
MRKSRLECVLKLDIHKKLEVYFVHDGSGGAPNTTRTTRLRL